jgi:hypothetical protein
MNCCKWKYTLIPFDGGTSTMSVVGSTTEGVAEVAAVGYCQRLAIAGIERKS